ncbi:Oidioi.mRNA.OKI2018_I69.XSR.g15122.t1.cds [Oikopleura dioica]|uniref:Oidioi.mRNA.OKI2018_I69.XSR.g15122.t1.cds n=1 Tax=Oikopleura dioica TaxID=34765 RepID=A0ABN7SFU5_OIKDI|nr:Oidioi.mRNA.OKI2018_I69.XSR.g15122.t1.cds [Oikopleura dioica]
MTKNKRSRAGQASRFRGQFHGFPVQNPPDYGFQYQQFQQPPQYVNQFQWNHQCPQQQYVNHASTYNQSYNQVYVDPSFGHPPSHIVCGQQHLPQEYYYPEVDAVQSEVNHEISISSVEHAEEHSFIRSGESKEEVRTIFVTGLPRNVHHRELFLLFTGGGSRAEYEGCVLKPPPPTGGQTVCFATFTSHFAARRAKESLDGFRLTLHNQLKVEMAKSTTRIPLRRCAAIFQNIQPSSQSYLPLSVTPNSLALSSSPCSAPPLSPALSPPITGYEGHFPAFASAPMPTPYISAAPPQPYGNGNWVAMDSSNYGPVRYITNDIGGQPFINGVEFVNRDGGGDIYYEYDHRL